MKFQQFRWQLCLSEGRGQILNGLFQLFISLAIIALVTAVTQFHRCLLKSFVVYFLSSKYEEIISFLAYCIACPCLAQSWNISHICYFTLDLIKGHLLDYIWPLQQISCKKSNVYFIIPLFYRWRKAIFTNIILWLRP